MDVTVEWNFRFSHILVAQKRNKFVKNENFDNISTLKRNFGDPPVGTAFGDISRIISF